MTNSTLTLAAWLATAAPADPGLTEGEDRAAIQEAREEAMIDLLLDLEDWVDLHGGFGAIRDSLGPYEEAVIRELDTPIPSRYVPIGANQYQRGITQESLKSDWTEGERGEDDPVAVILHFAGLLREYGIDLIVAPVPSKIELYYEDLGIDLPERYPVCPGRIEKVMDLIDAGIEVVDILPAFWDAKPDAEVPLYELDGHHPSGLGARLAGDLIARRLERYDLPGSDPTRFEVRRRTGTERVNRARPMKVWQVLGDDGRPYEHVEDSPVVVIGDSHAFAYSTASWASHIARACGIPITDLSESSGGQTAHIKFGRLGRDSVSRRKVVIWILTSVILADRTMERASITDEPEPMGDRTVEQVQSQLARFRQAREEDPDFPIPATESELNRVGYQLLELDEMALAIELFTVITEEWPDSANAFDSLGEAFLLAGRKQEAADALTKALSLGPAEDLRGKIEGRLENLAQAGKG